MSSLISEAQDSFTQIKDNILIFLPTIWTLIASYNLYDNTYNETSLLVVTVTLIISLLNYFKMIYKKEMGSLSQLFPILVFTVYSYYTYNNISDIGNTYFILLLIFSILVNPFIQDYIMNLILMNMLR